MQTVYWRDTLGIPNEKLKRRRRRDLDIGYPYGVSGARMVMHA